MGLESCLCMLGKGVEQVGNTKNFNINCLRCFITILSVVCP